MIVMNKGKRSYIVDPSTVISGGELTYDKRAVYINPGERVNLEDGAAKRLISVYQDLMPLEEAKTKKGK